MIIHLREEYEKLIEDHKKVKHVNSQLRTEINQLKHIIMAKDNEIINLKDQLKTLKENILKALEQ